ncbi:MAG: DUF937 domain-containing protein [Clostridiales bacterium]|nr:DUF937 domain-containing protein [Candidatus Cacconaster stercorequi]
MDINSILGTMLSNESISALSENTGASESEVKKVLGSALPALLTGAGNESGDKSLADAFLGAAMKHGSSDTSNLSSYLKKVDTDDGAKIVNYLLGASGDDTSVQSIASDTKVSKAKTNSILANAAPLLMSLLGQGAASSGKGSSIITTLAMAALMNNLLGGGNSSQQSSGLDLGGIIGGLQGGGTTATTTTTTGKKKKKPASSGANNNAAGGLLDGLMGLLK